MTSNTLPTTKIVLITNLEAIEINKLTLKANAIVITSFPEYSNGVFTENKHAVRFFSTDASTELTYGIHLTTPDFEIIPPKKSTKGVRFSSRAYKLDLQSHRWQGGKVSKSPVIELFTMDDLAPPDVHVISGQTQQYDSSLIKSTWDMLPKKVAKYWKYPSMPVTTWRNAQDERRKYS